MSTDDRAVTELVRAGLQLVLDHPARLLDGGLRIEDVVIEAGSSSATFYRKFATKAGYLSKVLDGLIADNSPTPTGVKATVQSALDAADRDRIRAVRKLVIEHFDIAFSDRSTTRRLLAITLGSATRQSAHLVRANYDHTDRLILDVFDVLFARSGATLRKPLTTQSFCVVMTALVEGFAVRHRADPSAVSPQLVADAVLAVLHVAVDTSQRHAHIEDVLTGFAPEAPETTQPSKLPSEPRAALLDAAREQFTKRGYFMTGLDSIALEARVATSVATRIFPTKTQIIIDALKPSYTNLAQEIADDLLFDFNSVATIRRHFVRIARLVIDQRAFMDALMAAVAHDTYAEADGLISIKKELNFPGLLEPLLVRARDSGELDIDQPTGDVAALLTNTLLLRCFTRRNCTPEKNAEFVATVILDGLLPR